MPMEIEEADGYILRGSPKEMLAQWLKSVANVDELVIVQRLAETVDQIAENCPISASSTDIKVGLALTLLCSLPEGMIEPDAVFGTS